MAQALYRRYRSLTLSDIIGQEHITSALSGALSQGKISHAYLFVGPRGTGKTSVARILAHAINGFDYQLEDHYLDIIEIDAASNTSVDNIRELKEKALIAPSQGKYKVYIIDEVHMLSKSAFNALLKILEEPPAHIVFIMATTDAHKVPITITSRAQVFTFRLASAEVLTGHLAQIAEQEGIAIERPALALIAKRGKGSFRDAISLLDQISTLKTNQTITASDINSALGLPTEETISHLLTAFAHNDAPGVTKSLQDLFSAGIKPETIAEEVLQRLVAAPEPVFLPLLAELAGISGQRFPLARLLVAFLLPLYQAPNNTKTSIPSVHPVEKYVEKPVEKPVENFSPVPPSVTSFSKAPVSASSSAQSQPSNSSSVPHSTLIQPTLAPPVNAKTFNFDTFLENVKSSSYVVFSQIKQATVHLTDHQVTFTLPNSLTVKILSQPQNLQIIKQYLGDLELQLVPASSIQALNPAPASSAVPAPSAPPVITDPAPATTSIHTSPSDNAAPSSDPFSQLSAIMGEVKEVDDIDGEVPF